MAFGVGIEKAPDHALIGRIVLRRLMFEEFDATLAQCQRDLYAFFSKNKLLRWRKKVRHDP